ncbi:LOW QUALITY PROTEIN: carboxypeptidase [Paramyrothecium foliicola]|nr:LOW QUALITY PROTEIN: carboxypeptidase [Paramyrothecium foliicola]
MLCKQSTDISASSCLRTHVPSPAYGIGQKPAQWRTQGHSRRPNEIEITLVDAPVPERHKIAEKNRGHSGDASAADPGDCSCQTQLENVLCQSTAKTADTKDGIREKKTLFTTKYVAQSAIERLEYRESEKTDDWCGFTYSSAHSWYDNCHAHFGVSSRVLPFVSSGAIGQCPLIDQERGRLVDHAGAFIMAVTGPGTHYFGLRPAIRREGTLTVTMKHTSLFHLTSWCFGAAVATSLPPWSGQDQKQLLSNPPAGAQDGSSFRCDVPPALDPVRDGLPSNKNRFTGNDALAKQVHRHQAIVQVPTVCYDDLGDLHSDERWQPFHQLQEVLNATYPLVHQHFTLTKINTFGLVFTLQGSDASLKPVLLTAHQDVVPVTEDGGWTYPPFSAIFDGTWLWGRGSADDKNSLTAIMSAAEALLETPGWAPKRTIILAFGFDEECSGYRGAGEIGKHLKSMYGEYGIELILDEGSDGLQDAGGGVTYAPVGVLEKGHLDIYFELHVRGGHSSTPPPHSAIGIISEIVAALEQHRYEPKITPASPIYPNLVCKMVHSPELNPELHKYIRSGDLDGLGEQFAALGPLSRFAITSAVAVTTIVGGQKINAMPEAVTLGVNFRIAQHDSIPKAQHDVLLDIQPVLQKYRLNVSAFDGDADYHQYVRERRLSSVDRFDAVDPEAQRQLAPSGSADSGGRLTLRAADKFNVTPVAPTQGTTWDVLTGTIRHTFGSGQRLVVPIGNVMMGNTDTRHYSDLSHNIYRWMPIPQGDMKDYHAVNERVKMESQLNMVAFYHDLLRNAQLI